MSLFDPQDLQDYLGSGVVIDPAQAIVLDQVVTGLITAYLGYDPSPSATPITVTLSMEYDYTVRLPQLVGTVTAVQANGINVQYVRHGNTLTVASATLPTSWFLVWVNDRTVDVTYTYTTVPVPLAAAALLTAATMRAQAVQVAQVGLLKSSQIDDYQAAYYGASELYGANGLPPQATALLRQYRLAGRSVKFRTPSSSPVGP